MMPRHSWPPGYQEEQVVQVQEVEALSRRVKEVLRQCNEKLVGSRSGIDELASKRHGLAIHLREAEEDFMRMGYDWHNIEKELKAVRQTLTKDARFAHITPRSRDKMLDAMIHTKEGSLPHDGKHTPRSDDVSTEIVSTTPTERRNLREGGEHGEWTPVPEEASDPSSIAAILSAAAGRSSNHEDVLAASRAAAEASTGRSDRSTPGASSSPHGYERTVEPSRDRATTWAHARSQSPGDDEDEDFSPPAPKYEGAAIIGDALQEIQRSTSSPGGYLDAEPALQRPARKHRTLPAQRSGMPPPPSPYSDMGNFSPDCDGLRHGSRY